MKQIKISWTWEYLEPVEVPDDWEWDGTLDALLEFTDMKASHPSAELTDWEPRP